MNNSKFSYALHTFERGRLSDPKASRFYGDPYVPASLADKFDENFIFLAQLRLDMLKVWDSEELLPHEGYLYLFIDAEMYPSNDLYVFAEYTTEEPDTLLEGFNARSPIKEGLNEPYEIMPIAGKARYLAPEVVRNMKRPDALTDRFSLTVVLYRLLFLDHPLEGRRVVESPCLTEELELKFYGREPVFVYDPTDASNRPVHGVHPNEMRLWGLYPQFVRDKFIEALSKSAMTGADPRPTDNDWQLTFSRLRDCIVKCPCGEETFLNLQGDSRCLGCGRTIPKPPVLNCHNNKYAVPMFPGVKLYRLHIDSGVDDYSEAVGEVVRNPQKPDLWGLRNLSGIVWNVETKSGEIRPVESGKLAPVAAIRAIHFPNGNAIIE